MFERYTEKARRTIFFARYEASLLGGPAIEVEHLLLGLLRENQGLFQQFFPSPGTVSAAIRAEIERSSTIHERLSASVDMPLSSSAKRVLMSAAAESQKRGHRHIGPEHLLLAVIQEEASLASQALIRHGLTAEKVITLMGGEVERFVSRTNYDAEIMIDMLLDLLVHKRVISEDERRAILDAGAGR
jgi:ATP-dependent Clp protease ATP-binding subunit ClpC